MGEKILALHDGHNASAAVFDGPELLAAISEERLNREKFYWGFPHRSVPEALKLAGVEMSDIDCIAVSHLSTRAYLARKLSTISTYDPRYFLGHIYNCFESYRRERTIRGFGGKRSYYFADHHRAHAASAYYFAGKRDALVVTIDALGDGLSHTAAEVKSDSWRTLASGDGNASLGAFYAAVTEGLGFKANRHEGKVVGLAALDSGEKARPFLDGMVVHEKGGLSFRRRGYAAIRGAVESAMQAGVSKEAIAACAQQMLERMVLGHLKALRAKTSVRFLALAGGVFANVKLNQRILEESGFDDIFIQPAMGDEGLVLGAPFLYLSQKGNRDLVRELDHLYLGNAVGESDIRAAALSAGFSVRELDQPARITAEYIAAGKIVGWFDGRMEFGPRALGARSIMADPRNRAQNDILNERLKRSDFMPFAPSVLAERADDIFDIKGAQLAAEYMTITMNVREEWKDRVPAIVHADGTARPQLVRREKNEAYHRAIAAFSDITGVPLVLNTSFNIHEEPIVSSAEDALRSLVSGAVDCVVFNNRWVVEGKGGA